MDFSHGNASGFYQLLSSQILHSHFFPHQSAEHTAEIQKSFSHKWQPSKWKSDNNQLHSAPAFGMIAFELKPTAIPTVDIRSDRDLGQCR